MPGGLYQVHSAVAGAAGAAPLIDETLTLVSAEREHGDPGDQGGKH